MICDIVNVTLMLHDTKGAEMTVINYLIRISENMTLKLH